MELDIILISYNQEAFIAKAIDSILAQKVADNIKLNLYIADDVSTDSTLDIVKEHLAGSDIHAEFLPKQRNAGYIQNYRQAFAACKGDYIAILEGDDYWLKNHLNQHITFLEEHNDCSMSMNEHHRLLPDGTLHEPAWNQESDVRRVSIEEQIGSGNQLGNLSACIFRGILIRELPDSFFDLNMADWELGAFMAQYGDIAILKGSTSVYRISSKGQWAGLTVKEKEKSLIADLKAMDEFFDRRYHGLCQKYKFKVLHPHLQKIKHSCGVTIRKILR